MSQQIQVARPSERAKGWFTCEVGALIRGQVRREIEGGAWGRGLDIETQESKGLLESVYRFTVHGESAVVAAFMSDIEHWFKENVE